MIGAFVLILVAALLIDLWGLFKHDGDVVAVASGITIVDLIANALHWFS